MFACICYVMCRKIQLLFRQNANCVCMDCLHNWLCRLVHECTFCIYAWKWDPLHLIFIFFQQTVKTFDCQILALLLMYTLSTRFLTRSSLKYFVNFWMIRATYICPDPPLNRSLPLNYVSSTAVGTTFLYVFWMPAACKAALKCHSSRLFSINTPWASK